MSKNSPSVKKRSNSKYNGNQIFKSTNKEINLNFEREGTCSFFQLIFIYTNYYVLGRRVKPIRNARSLKLPTTHYCVTRYVS